MNEVWLRANAEVAAIRQMAGDDKRIAFVSGNFNTLHPGHIRILRFAHETADFLVVGVNRDGTPGVSVAADLRLEGVKALGFVDYAFLLHEPAENFLVKLKPDFVVKGKEYESQFNAEKIAVDYYGGKLLFSSGEMRFSLSEVVERDYDRQSLASIRKPYDYPLRHGFKPDRLKAVLRNVRTKRVVVVGDLIIDSYIECDPLGMSQEDPTIVVTPLEEKKFLGGAGIVAAHARGLGAHAHFVTVSGQDVAMEFAKQKLDEYGVSADVLVDTTRPTTWKNRYRAHGKTLLRINHLRQHAISEEISRSVIAKVLDHLDGSDLLLFSDFNYGCLSPAVVHRLTAEAKRCGVLLAADSQASSQLADISRFKDMSLITPTEREARLALQDSDSGLVVLAEKLQRVANAENVVITLGAEGLLVHGCKHTGSVTDRLPAFNVAPRDVAGAGDSFLTCAALALTTKADIWQSAYLGSLAAACQVSRVGNVPLNADEIVSEIDAPDPEWTGAI